VETARLVFEPDVPPLPEVGRVFAAYPRVEVQEDGPVQWHQIVVFSAVDEDDLGPHVYLRLSAHVRRDPGDYFSHWPPGLAPESAGAFSLDYRDQELAKRVVLELAGRYRFWIDTNNGELYTSEGFARRCAREPGWDWYADAPRPIPEVYRLVE